MAVQKVEEGAVRGAEARDVLAVAEGSGERET
jgi:hypothetical protein